MYGDFLHAARRMQAYIHGLGSGMRPVPGLVVRTIEDLGAMVQGVLNSWSVGRGCVGEADVRWYVSLFFLFTS